MKSTKMAMIPLIALVSAILLLSACGNDGKQSNASQSNATNATNQVEQGSSGNQSNGNESTDATDDSPDNNASSDDKVMSWSTPPAMEIDKSKSYHAEVSTTKGSFTIELFAKDAPVTVNNFVFLSKQGYYDNVIFHRIIETFMIQTGDPLGNGTGGPGYQFEDELIGLQYEPGTVAMANAGPNTNGSQFFICTGEESSFLNSQPYYTVFGKVTEGMDIVQAIAKTPVEMNDFGETSKPTDKIEIVSVNIVEK